MSSANSWWNVLINAAASAGQTAATATGATASSVASAISSTLSTVLQGKYTTAIASFKTLQTFGPTADPDVLADEISTLRKALEAIQGVPQAEFTFLAQLKSLVGKTDAPSAKEWVETCNDAVSLLSNASSIF